MIVRLRCSLLMNAALFLPLFAQPSDQSAISRAELQVQLFGPPTTSQISRASSQGVVPAAPGRKSVGLAAIYSLLLPGMGELYADGFSTGKYFLIAEGAIWLTYAGFSVYGDALRDDARAFAVAHAGISLSGKDDQFFVDIGNFMSIDDYNDKKLRDRDLAKVYDPTQGYAWNWDSDLSRSNYREQRVASDNVYNNRKFVLAAVLLNHVASAVNAARSVIARNADVGAQQTSLQFGAQVLGGPGNIHGVALTLQKYF